jgi:class 3 adenylate cyclase
MTGGALLVADGESLTHYVPPAVPDYPGKWLVAESGSGSIEVFLFFDRVEIGRYKESRKLPGCLLVNDPTVSSRHCVITQEPDGRCFVRDVSRNGTRLDGRRLSPNLRTEISPGQVLSIGQVLRLRLDGRAPLESVSDSSSIDTFGVADTTVVTVLVGDIRNYTSMVRIANQTDLQDSVNRVFGRLEREVQELGGTLKEFQGDALFAYWEQTPKTCHASQACRAALRLNSLVAKLGADPSVWRVAGIPLGMDFALSTGMVTISGYGSDGALGLSMVGESVVLAFRIEKLANKKTGPIIVCPITRQIANDGFEFKELGRHSVEGFGADHKLYALVKEK